MANKRDWGSVILKAITTIIASGVILGLILNFSDSYTICGDQLTPLFATITLLIIGLEIAAAIAIWWRPSIGGILFILSSGWVFLGACLEGDSRLLAFSSILCGFLTLAVWVRTKGE